MVKEEPNALPKSDQSKAALSNQFKCHLRSCMYTHFHSPTHTSTTISHMFSNTQKFTHVGSDMGLHRLFYPLTNHMVSQRKPPWSNRCAFCPSHPSGPTSQPYLGSLCSLEGASCHLCVCVVESCGPCHSIWSYPPQEPV